MKFYFSLAAVGFSLAGAPLASADIFINEIRANQVGNDNHEYFELFNSGDTAVDLSDHSFLILGDGTGSTSGSIESVVPLTGQTIQPGGYLTVLDPAGLEEAVAREFDATGDGVVDVTAAVDLFNRLDFESGDNITVLLVQGFTGADGDDLDPTDSGALSVTPWTSVVDSISFVGDGDELSYAPGLGFPENLVGLETTFPPSQVFRSPDGGSLVAGEFGTRTEAGVLSGSETDPVLDTPGAANPIVSTGALSLSFDLLSISENSFDSLTGTVTRTRSSGDLTIDLLSSDSSEATTNSSVTIPDGQTSATFLVTPADDQAPDGDQEVEISATASGFSPATITLTVTDDGNDVASVIFNEIHYQVSAINGDANRNGTVEPGDRGADVFIELVNITDTAINLSGYTFENSFTFTRNFSNHIFPNGTVLGAGCAIVVFGNAGPTPGFSEAFGEAEIQISSSNGLFIGTSGDVLSLVTSDGDEIASVTVPDQSASPEGGSLTLATDGDPASGYVLHTSTPGGGFFSPGLKMDGTQFCDITNSVSVSVSASSVSEAAGSAGLSATVSIPVALDITLPVMLLSLDDTELFAVDFPEPVIPAGATSVTIDIDVIDDTESDGTQVVTLRASASGYFPAEITVEVTDDEAPPVFSDQIVINEVDANQSGADTAEFVELYNLSDMEQSLDNLYLVFVNGNGEASYNFVDLTGATIPANGYFVIGAAGLNPDLQLTFSPQNGTDAVALYGGDPLAYPGNGPLTAIPAQLLDVTVYGGTEDPELNTALGYTGQTIPDTDNESVSRSPDGSGSFVAGTPTPGSANIAISTGGFEVTVGSVFPSASSFVINFTATGPVDVYRSTDLSSFGTAPIATQVAEGPFVDSAAPAGSAFYILVEAGSPAP